MQVSGMGTLQDLADDLGGNTECVILTGSRDEIRSAAPYFLSPAMIISPSRLIAIREAAERRDMDAIFKMTEI